MSQVCIIGLGYVGFPLAQLCLKKEKIVKGIDNDAKKIELINNGIDPIEKKEIKYKFEVSLDNPKFIKDSEVIIICVPTPVDNMKMPDYEPLLNALRYVAQNLGKNKPLIIVESTINPGVMEELVYPLFNNFKLGIDYNLAHCPERINPGDTKWNVENINRVVGGMTDECLNRAYEFYKSILTAEIMKMSSIRTAEAVKIVENTFRDVNIAFVNELAKCFSLMDIDIMEVIKGASTKPFAFMPHYPSCGVGGHCIPVDPYYLIEKAKSIGFDHKFLKLAREINESMPQYTVELLIDALNENKMCLNGTTVGILGLSYKGNVGDLRESPALIIIDILKKKGANVITYDPYIKSDCKSLDEIQNKCDIFILCADHNEFRNIDFNRIKIFIDGKNMFYDKKIKCIYKGIGRK
ncbi:MAG: nucleotide sugar dehydrogenase [Candidatus Goldbacteria bacterium]|nr:nucleotide sugar dehydrogenase [Candidatus Goldiibacteriota bacterium]